MWSRRELLVILSSILILIWTNSVSAMKARPQDYEFPHPKLIQDTSLHYSPGQVFGYCNDTLANTESVLCSFYYEDDTESVDNWDRHIRSCNFTTKSYLGQDRFTVKREIIAVGPYLAVLLTEQDDIDFLVIDFEWCRVIPFKLNRRQQFAFAKVWAQLKRTFNIHAWNLDGSCTRKKPCVFKATVLTKSVFVDGPSEWVKETSEVIASAASWAVTKGPHKLVADKYKEGSMDKLRVYTANNTHLIQLLKEYPIEEKNVLPYDRVVVSSTYELLTVCNIIKYDMHCSQYSFNTTLIFDTTLKITGHRRLFSVTIHNLPEGGFVVLSTECSRRIVSRFQGDLCVEDENKFFATKINAQGQPVGSIQVIQFLCASDSIYNRIHFFRRRQVELTQDVGFTSSKDTSSVWTEELYLSIACKKNPEPSGTVIFTVYTFTDEEFTNANSLKNIIKRDF